MKKLIIATKNKSKVKEIKELLKGYNYEVVSLDQAGINIEVEEKGKCFEENSIMKAKAIHDITGEMVVADDSGIEIDFLNGAPGIYSARFLGDVSDKERYEGVLALLDGIDDMYRTARFVCSASLVTGTQTMTFNGTVEGIIANSPKGKNGFGYDPIFYLPEYGKTMSELDDETKNLISHRGKAFKKLASWLKEWC